MPLHLDWADLTLRLMLAMLAGGIIGLNRELRGHAAGLRTTILVTLAACVAMIQANLLLPVGGKTAASFGVMDLMRMPLGILTGVGFIGGGAILKRGNLVTGITTAATLWVATVIGLCFGGGQNGLGIAGTILAFFTLSSLRRLDDWIPRRQRALATIRASVTDPGSPSALAMALRPLGYQVHLLDIAEEQPGGSVRRLQHVVRWKQAGDSGSPQELLARIESKFDLVSFKMATEDD